ncbi:MAG: cob(I)yrinic acid a,c-diamide adenosyltransferase [Thermoplasmatota archaeon]
MDEPFRAPRIAISRVYTKTGDDGRTALVGGERVPKDDARIEAYGTIDEVNAVVGLCRAAALEGKGDDFAALLLRVQQQLFNVGSTVATPKEKRGPNQPRIRSEDVAWLEGEMDRLTPQLPPLSSFVLPGGTRLNALLHVARTVCRRAERHLVGAHRTQGGLETEIHYLNRLSDALFVWSRWASKEARQPEVLWDPNAA